MRVIDADTLELDTIMTVNIGLIQKGILIIGYLFVSIGLPPI